MDGSLPESSIHGILQARMLEWVAILFSRGSYQPRDQIQVSSLQTDSLPSKPPRKAQITVKHLPNFKKLCFLHKLFESRFVSNKLF